MSEELALLDRILELSVPRIYSAERAGEVAGEKNEAIKALRQRLEAVLAERDAALAKDWAQTARYERELQHRRAVETKLAAATARAERAEAENARLREAMREEYRASHEVCNQADETRMAYGEIQMVEVPKWSIEWLKQAATVLDDALAPVEAKRPITQAEADQLVGLDSDEITAACKRAHEGGDDGR